MVKRTKAEALQTRERILDAAIEIFHARGVARPSLSEVAELAGVTRGAIYGHFRNKSDVFTALCDRIMLPLENLTAQAGDASAGDPLGNLRSVWVTLLQDAAADPQRQRILGIIFHRCELIEENGLILQRLQQGRETGMKSMCRLIRQAVAAGQLPADLDVERAHKVFHAAVAGLLSDWLFEQQAFDMKHEAAPVVDALIEMLRVAPTLRCTPTPRT